MVGRGLDASYAEAEKIKLLTFHTYQAFLRENFFFILKKMVPKLKTDNADICCFLCSLLFILFHLKENGS